MKANSLIFSMALVISLLLSGCAAAYTTGSPTVVVPPVTIEPGQTIAIQAGHAQYGVDQALAMAPGTQILRSPEGTGLIFRWISQSNPGVVYWWAWNQDLDMLKMIKAGGNAANLETYQQLTAALKDRGWRVVTAEEIGRAGLATLSTIASRALTTSAFVILPPGYDGTIDSALQKDYTAE